MHQDSSLLISRALSHSLHRHPSSAEIHLHIVHNNNNKICLKCLKMFGLFAHLLFTFTTKNAAHSLRFLCLSAGTKTLLLGLPIDYRNRTQPCITKHCLMDSIYQPLYLMARLPQHNCGDLHSINLTPNVFINYHEKCS